MFTFYLVAQLTFGAGDYDTALALLSFGGEEPRRTFMVAVCAHQTLRKELAVSASKEVIEGFGETPRRYLAVCQLIYEDATSWKDGLDKTGRMMKDVASRLDSAKGGPITQEKQKKILEDLDARIKKLENPDKGNGEANSRDVSSPKEQSDLPVDGGAKSTTDEKTFKKLAENWGSLPPLARQKIKQEIARQVPDKYKIMVESYFKSLNENK